jgi:hypothetical protein
VHSAHAPPQLRASAGSQLPIRAERDAAVSFKTVAARAALACVLSAALTPVAAYSRCGTGNVPSYSDVDAIMFTQNGCKGTIQDANVATLRNPQFPRGWFVSAFDCSTFWVLFWNNGRDNVPTTYSQYNLKNAVGLFDLSATPDDARALLEKDHFCDLNPHSLAITDTARAVLSVRRCGVITRISAFNTQGSGEMQDAPTLRLFDGFRALIAAASKKRISSAPKDFAQTLLFDP